MADRVPAVQARLHGRGAECAALDSVIEAARGGASRTLVLQGEAGIGKTALLRYAVESASDLRVLRAAGVESEMELAFAALHQLCGPLLDRVEQLPAPQRDALAIVLGLRAGAAPDGFLVALATLTMLSEAAEEQPLLCVVDDAQWLDHASARTLAFVARRLLAEPVALVVAAREPGAELRALPQLEVRGLGDGDARAVLASAIRVPLDKLVRDRIVAETHGNPLALLDLPRGLSMTELAGGFGLAVERGLSGRIEDSYVRRLEPLPEETRSLLLVAAAEPVGDPVLVLRAAERLGSGIPAAAAAQAEGLLTIAERVTFRHPLVRSAVYRSATPPERRAAHRALADATDPHVDPDRRAWHLAQAAAGPDEEVAVELERSAGRAQARGGFAAAAAFLQRSVALTREPARRADRALAAAQASLQSGAFDAALDVLATAEAGALDELQRARVDLLRGRIASASSFGAAAAQLLKAGKRLEPLDVELARDTYLDAWGAALAAGELAAGTLQDVSAAIRAAPPLPEEPRVSDLLLDGLALLITEGLAPAAPTLRSAVRAFRDDDDVLLWGAVAATAAAALWDMESFRAVIDRQVDLARDAGALALLATALQGKGICVTWTGEFREAASVIAEADAVTGASGVRISPYGGMLLAAYRGREAEASALLGTTIEDAAASGEGLGVQYARWATALLANGLGHYDDALANARQASEATPELFVSHWALSELVEAAVRSGRADVAREAATRLADVTRATEADWGLGIAARAQALASEGDDAEPLYAEAIDRLGRTPLRPELARAHLLYGEWLRRQNRRSDAREHLRTAHDLFTAIGMDAFAERTRRELLATGEKVRKRLPETRNQLTPQEEQIARLARDGLSNAEIGARLFLSPRTVEWHLHKVFGKLGISTRRALHDALPARRAEVVSV
jgi:DNA-binding CsgD family transcriptional regulator